MKDEDEIRIRRLRSVLGAQQRERWRERPKERNQEDDDWRGHEQEGQQKEEEVEPFSLVILVSLAQRFDVLVKPPLCLDLKPEPEEEEEQKQKQEQKQEQEQQQKKRKREEKRGGKREGEERGLRLLLL